MDDFVCSRLTEWGFGNLIERFQDEEVDKESLFCLEDEDIDRLIPKTGPKAKFKRRLEEMKSQQTFLQEANLEQVSPSSSAACENEKRKRKLDLKTDNPGKIKRQSNIAPGTHKDDLILMKVKHIMGDVHDKLSYHPSSSTKLNAFLRNKIWDLSTDKKELVGVFGKTGAGKSSLINAIVQEKDLLPTGTLTACTTVMIKVEANTQSNRYEAEIEFMSKEEWKDELWCVKNLFGNEEMEANNENCDDNAGEEKDDDEEYNDYVEKMTALYGDEWKNKSPENLMEPKYFKEIPEFLQSQRKTVPGKTAKELSAKVLKYTRTDVGKRCFWPLVKCVTVRVPNNDFLKHVTIVDLPGNGDRNKSRDQMWKKIVASCSTVWIVSEITRAVADRDAWDILKDTCGLMGNGGECQNIHFICTKSDSLSYGGHGVEISHEILNSNSKAKDLVRKEFNKLNRVKKQFKDDCFKVFTVSSEEFLKSASKCLQDDETEIPKLQELLRSLNDQHDLTLNYVSGAHGILSLIQGAKDRKEPNQTALVCANLNKIINGELQKVKKSMEDAYGMLEKCLCTGVEQSKNSCEAAFKKILNPRRGGRGFCSQLRCALQNKGIHKRKKKQINLNNAISIYLTDSIDEEFRKMFPNDAKCGPFYGSIQKFSLNTTGLCQQLKHFELLLTFLNMEEAKLKAKLCKNIRDRKKIIYSSLAETVAETMQECYTEAAKIRGPGSLENMKRTVENHLHDVKDTVFEKAKNVMLSNLKKLMEDVQKILRETLLESVELSFRSDDKSVPDFENEFEEVKKHYDKLTG